MRGRSIFLILLTFMLVCTTLDGQSGQQMISVGNLKLSLGMPRDVVLAKLAESYQLKTVAEDSWLVSTKTGPPFSTVANVGFKNDKLNTIVKYWGPEDQQKGFEFARSLYAAIDSLAKNGASNCTVGVNASDEPGFEGKAVFISCGQRFIRIDLNRSEKFGESTDIAEVLQTK